MPGKIVSKTELSAIWDISPRTLTIWQNQGMPFVKAEVQGTENQYDTAECTNWRITREAGKSDSGKERAALFKEQAEAARRKNEIASGRVIPMDHALEVVQRLCADLTQGIRVGPFTHEQRDFLYKYVDAMKSADLTTPTPSHETKHDV